MIFFKPMIELVENILAGTRAALFMPVHLWLFKSGYLQLCLLLIVLLGLSIFDDYSNAVPGSYFNPYNFIAYQALDYLLFFFSLILIAVINARQRDLDKLIILFLSVVPAIWLVTVCLSILAKQQTYFDTYQTTLAVIIVYILWYLLVVFRLIKRFFYCGVLPALAYVMLYAAINIPALLFLPTVPLWYPAQTANMQTERLKGIDVESIYYAQNTLLKDAINDLVEGRDGITDLFFIGFAGDADEDVFMNEALAAQDIMKNYFGTFGRSLVLINNEDTVDSIPLANGHNLKNSINETAKLMNTEEDILLLFLTSHGSEDHYLSANFPPFRLNDINATSINKALNEAGIKWRIIIVSACYSGGFIEPLADPYTLIITAANADRNSFGCGHDGKYTYFGDAYFENGLRQTRSFIKAFDHAKKIIYDKEDKEGFKNSDPQIRLGSEIENKLIEFEKRLKAKGNANWASTASG